MGPAALPVARPLKVFFITVKNQLKRNIKKISRKEKRHEAGQEWAERLEKATATKVGKRASRRMGSSM